MPNLDSRPGPKNRLESVANTSDGLFVDDEDLLVLARRDVGLLLSVVDDDELVLIGDAITGDSLVAVEAKVVSKRLFSVVVVVVVLSVDDVGSVVVAVVVDGV